jgi:hypothetical protein
VSAAVLPGVPFPASVAGIRLTPRPNAPGYWWVAAERDPDLGQLPSGGVYPSGAAWVACGPRVRVVDAALATPHATPRAAAEAAYTRERAVRPALREVARGLPGWSLRAFDGNAYDARPERWDGRWAEAVEGGRRVMLGADVAEAEYLARYTVEAAPWQSAAVAFCRAFPRLWLVIGDGSHGWSARRRGEYVEFLYHAGAREYTYLSRDGATVVLVEID